MPQSCNIIPADCSVCFRIETLICPNRLLIPTGISSGTQLYLWLRDKFQNLYYDLIIIDGFGTAILDPGNFPAGLFNIPGFLDMFLTSDVDGSNVVPMQISSVEYNCVIIEVEPE